MASVSKSKYKRIVLQKDVNVKDVLFVPKLILNQACLTNAIENTGVALSSKGQIISLTVGNTEIYFNIVSSMVQDVSLERKSILRQITLLSLLRL
jgi:hypothetical protein